MLNACHATHNQQAKGKHLDHIAPAPNTTRHDTASLLQKLLCAGVQLEGQDAAKYGRLAERLQAEQKEYLHQLRAKAFSLRQRYTHYSAEASQQVEVLLSCVSGTYIMPMVSGVIA